MFPPTRAYRRFSRPGGTCATQNADPGVGNAGLFSERPGGTRRPISVVLRRIGSGISMLAFADAGAWCPPPSLACVKLKTYGSNYENIPSDNCCVPGPRRDRAQPDGTIRAAVVQEPPIHNRAVPIDGQRLAFPNRRSALPRHDDG